jgi:glycopeptide antibiotics resistance protein
MTPEQYLIQDEALLKPFWREFALSQGYWESVLKNIVGLVPLGFFFYSWVSRRTSARRAALITTILGAIVSITIEVLQAQLPTRQSGTTDILTNTLGTWLGVVCYRYFEIGRHQAIAARNGA